MNKLKVAAILLGIVYVYTLYNWGFFLYKIFYESNSRVTTASTWVQILISIAGIAFYMQFLFTGFKKSQLLRAFLFYECFSGMVWLVNWLFIYTKRYIGLTSSPEIFRVIVFSLIILIINFVALSLLQKERIPKYESLNNGGENVFTFSPVSKGMRFAHRIIDLVFVAIMFISTVIVLRVGGLPNMQLVVYEALLLFVYYFVMETVFKVTLGKIFTRSIVVNRRGQKAGSWDILKRALCRFIPFDALSFLFNDRGWHDQLSDTYVIHDKYEWETDEDAFNTYFTGEPESELTSTINL